MSDELVGIADIDRAAERLRPLVKRTPTYRNDRLSAQTGANLFVKAKSLQHAGSFKVRGAEYPAVLA